MSPTEKTGAIVRNDEPTAEDRLNREQYAAAFARLAETCETPLVVGIYGTWGVGKTSLMRIIEKNLDKEKARAVWFDPWQHQFDENPVLGLVHTLINNLVGKRKEEAKKILAVIAGALGYSVGARLLKPVMGIDAKDIDKIGKRYEEELFLVREYRVRLKEHFQKLVQKARGGVRRPKKLVFFIDDLDRCMPEQALKLLEALKLYLNLEGCVYFLGVDRQALEKSISHCYKGLDIKESEYLDKIVQLPFTVPPDERQLYFPTNDN